MARAKQQSTQPYRFESLHSLLHYAATVHGIPDWYKAAEFSWSKKSLDALVGMLHQEGNSIQTALERQDFALRVPILL